MDDIYSLAASYVVAIFQAHWFDDENTRAAFQVIDLILDLNGINVT
jgi:prophage maintenance system killer protein